MFWFCDRNDCNRFPEAPYWRGFIVPCNFYLFMAYGLSYTRTCITRSTSTSSGLGIPEHQASLAFTRTSSANSQTAFKKSMPRKYRWTPVDHGWAIASQVSARLGLGEFTVFLFF